MNLANNSISLLAIAESVSVVVQGKDNLKFQYYKYLASF